MSTLILVRHGRSTANTSGILAGRTPGVHLDETGREQVLRTAERLSPIALAAVVSSPLERTRQTADAILALQDAASPATLTLESGLLECDYGDWQNRTIAELAQEDLWKTVTETPTRAVFPGGESVPQMQARAVAAVRRHDERIRREHGDGAVWAAVSHGDIIKSLVADAFGLPLDNFQRIHADPASVTVISYTSGTPHVLCLNTTAGDLSWLSTLSTGNGTPGIRVGGGKGH